MAQGDLLRTLAEKHMDEAIAPEELSPALTTFPFVTVPGTFNTRCLAHPPLVRPGLIYRSGSLSSLAAEGRKSVADQLKIKTIFDLRSAGEKKAFPMPIFADGDGGGGGGGGDGPVVQVVSLSFDSPPAEMDLRDYARPEPTTHSSGAASTLWTDGARGFSKQYLEILATYKTAFRQILSHLIGKPDTPILFNCTAGKDRTGVLAALILALAGVPDDAIAFDYSLSRIGVESQKAFLTAVVRKWKPEWTPQTPGMSEFSNVRPEYMIRFLQDARVAYDARDDSAPGGRDWAERYVLHELGLSAADLETLRANLK